VFQKGGSSHKVVMEEEILQGEDPDLDKWEENVGQAI
jgi:hypothetical protein